MRISNTLGLDARQGVIIKLTNSLYSVRISPLNPRGRMKFIGLSHKNLKSSIARSLGLLKYTSTLKCILGFSYDCRLVLTVSIKVPAFCVLAYLHKA